MAPVSATDLHSESFPGQLGEADSMLRLRLIGQMEAWTPTGANVTPAGRKTRAMLAIVALSVPRPVTRERLAEMLWSRRP